MAVQQPGRRDRAAARVVSTVAKLAVVEHPPLGLVDDVVGDVELGVEDDAEQAVAADDEAEELRLLRRG